MSFNPSASSSSPAYQEPPRTSQAEELNTRRRPWRTFKPPKRTSVLSILRMIVAKTFEGHALDLSQIELGAASSFRVAPDDLQIMGAPLFDARGRHRAFRLPEADQRCLAKQRVIPMKVP